jgi:hypothetical protein
LNVIDISTSQNIFDLQIYKAKGDLKAAYKDFLIVVAIESHTSKTALAAEADTALEDLSRRIAQSEVKGCA